MMRLRWLLPICVWAVSNAAWGAAATTTEAHKLFEWRPFLAPFHAVVLHLPIGFIAVAAILEFFRSRWPGSDLKRAIILITWLALGAGLVSAGLGLLRAQGGGYEEHTLALHRIFGLCLPAATLLTLGLQWFAYGNGSTKLWNFAYRVALVGCLGLVVIAGHYGGNLTHGSKYLVENAPEFLREWIDEENPAAAVSPESQDEHQRLYTTKVLPILQQKCFSCHGPEKQKGKYRMDLPESAKKGGESEKPAIVPGDPVGSQVVQRILLPPDHDDIMPPSGKTQLTSEEMMIVIDWIRAGAVFPEAGSQTNAPVKTPDK